MRRRRSWHRTRRRGVAEIIGAILLVALTIVAGLILWTFRINTPSAPPTVGFVARSGLSYPVYGDPSDCQPQGNWVYPLTSAEKTPWSNEWYPQCYTANGGGNFSTMNASELIVSTVSTTGIPLSQIQLTFLCNGAYAPAPYTTQNTTALVSGTLASMTWFPGSTSQPAPNAPYLGWCGGFDAGNWSYVPGLQPAYGWLYNRLALFVPLTPGNLVLQAGDTFILYLHDPQPLGYPLDFLCVSASLGFYPSWVCPSGWGPVPHLDFDDFHGAPYWCQLSAAACTIQITYTGNPSTVLAQIPVTNLLGPRSS